MRSPVTDPGRPGGTRAAARDEQAVDDIAAGVDRGLGWIAGP